LFYIGNVLAHVVGGGGGPKVHRAHCTTKMTLLVVEEFEPLFPLKPNPMMANDFGS
jgi:hypothetical protein